MRPQRRQALAQSVGIGLGIMTAGTTHYLPAEDLRFMTVVPVEGERLTLRDRE